VTGKGGSAGRDAVHFVVPFIGIVVTASLLSLTAFTKVFLIGAAIVALAVWGKRKLKQECKS
jgi:hypothetical protein